MKCDTDDEHALLPHLDKLNNVQREAVSPVERLQHLLHGSVAYGIMPLFALANAGVPLGEASLRRRWAACVSRGNGRFGVGQAARCARPVLARFARVGLTALPRGVRWSKVSVVGLCAGIGFTMALFIAQLAISARAAARDREAWYPLAVRDRRGRLPTGAGRRGLREEEELGQAATCEEAESSTTA